MSEHSQSDPRPSGLRQLTEEDAENEIGAVICVRDRGQQSLANAQRSTCTKCGHAVLYSPTSPSTPPKVCMDCALAGGMLGADNEIVTTARQIQELRRELPELFGSKH